MNKKMKRGLIIGGQATVASALVLGTVGFVANNKSIEVVVDGESQNVRTFGGKVEDALRAGDINVGKHDKVTPAIDSDIANGDTVHVLTAHEVNYTVDGEEKTVMTTARTVDELVDELKLEDGSDINLDGDVQLASAETLTVLTPKEVKLDLAGKKSTLTTTALDVDAVLEEKGVKVGKDDEVKPARNTVVSEGITITYNKIEKKKETKTEKIAFETKRENDSSLPKGQTKTVKAGKSGERKVVTETVLRNGKKVSSKKVSDEVTREPVDALVKVGTKKAETKSASSSSSSSSSSSGSKSKAKAPTGNISATWKALAQGESGGNWSINTGNGYYGGLQFSASSWRAAGGTKYAPLPHQATPAEQIATAEKLRANGGWGHWPACSARLGLR